MYLDDWLIIGDSIEDYKRIVIRTLAMYQLMGFFFNLRKSHLLPSLNITWLRRQWSAHGESVAHSLESRRRCWRKVFKAVFALSMTRRHWESLVGSLNQVADVLTLGSLRLQRLILEGHKGFASAGHDTFLQFPPRLRLLCRWWLSSVQLVLRRLASPKPFL